MEISSYRVATSEEAEAITDLVNKTYRPAAGDGGWTHESRLVSGDRTDVSQVKAIIARQESVVLLGLGGDEIVGCVHVEQDGDDTHIGMLAVRPDLQGLGLGKEILAYAEDYAKSSFRPKRFVMTVITARSELIAFYSRRGYRPTGAVMDYPRSAGVGVPRDRDLTIGALEKQA